eukprot:8383352-Pyramimonas_sp.AAC.1
MRWKGGVDEETEEDDGEGEEGQDEGAVGTDHRLSPLTVNIVRARVLRVRCPPRQLPAVWRHLPAPPRRLAAR